MTIWKYPITPSCTLKMPRGATLLTVQTQHNEPQLWALVDPHAEMEQRNFMVFGTGHKVPTHELRLRYIATFQLEDGALVFHVFEVEGPVT